MIRGKKQASESLWVSVAGYLKKLLDILVTIYLFLIIAVMPFYFQEGYNHIGSDKSYFYRTYTMYAAKVFLPLLAAYLFCLLAEWVRINREQPLLEALRTGIKNLRLSATDLFVAGYALSVVVSYHYSAYKSTALWGTEGWYMGMIPQLMAVGIYFAVSRLWKKKNWEIYLFLPVSAAVFLLGYLNRFDIWPIPMENSGLPNFISTIGNINWYCGYMVSVLFLGIGLFWLDKGEKKWKTILLALYCLIGSAAIVTQGSDSGLFALAIVVWILFIMSAHQTGKYPKRLERFWQMEVLFAGACLGTGFIWEQFPKKMNFCTKTMEILIGKAPTAAEPATEQVYQISRLALLFLGVGIAALGMAYLQRRNQKVQKAAGASYRVLAVTAGIMVPLTLVLLVVLIVVNTKEPGCIGKLSDYPMFTFGTNWGSSRGDTWMAGWRCFQDQNVLHKLVGIGPDCMANYIYQGGNEELLQLVRSRFHDTRLTNAHFEWLTILADCGIFGALCFVGIILSSIIRLLKAADKNSLATACGLCVLAYTANNIWSFQQSMGLATIFVMLGMGENNLRFSGRCDKI